MPTLKQISIFVPERLVERADALLPEFSESADAPMGQVTRSDVLRAALVRGLAVLERQLPEATHLPGD